jgi:hypothetical protein
MRDSCIFYRSFYESINELPDTNKLEIYNAIFSYSLNFIEPELSGLSKSIFTLIKPQLDANIKRFNNGLQPKDKQIKSKTEAKRKQNRSKVEANNNVNDNNNSNDNLNNNENNNTGESPKTPLEMKFIEFVNYRKATKKPIRNESMESFKKQLWTLSGQNEQTAIEILEQSIANGYQGIFELKNNKNSKNGKPANHLEQRRAEILSKYNA